MNEYKVNAIKVTVISGEEILITQKDKYGAINTIEVSLLQVDLLKQLLDFAVEASLDM